MIEKLKIKLNESLNHDSRKMRLTSLKINFSKLVLLHEVYDKHGLDTLKDVSSEIMGYYLKDINITTLKNEWRVKGWLNNNTNQVQLFELAKELEDVLNISKQINELNVYDDIKQQYYSNHKMLLEVAKSYNIESSKYNIEIPKEGCYIATMVYGDYEHYQVIKLRKFRDDYLKQNSFGRITINLYYRFSPKMVEKLKNSKLSNKIIRNLLDVFIKKIKI